jgi:hypothetical protein
VVIVMLIGSPNSFPGDFLAWQFMSSFPHRLKASFPARFLRHPSLSASRFPGTHADLNSEYRYLCAGPLRMWPSRTN